MRIHLFPIEPLTERYSADWLRWWPAELVREGFETKIHMGMRLRDKIEQGQFLDAVDTNFFKATQLAFFCQAVSKGQVAEDDIVLVLDAWSPTVAQLAYIRDTVGPKFKIVGILHAGTWDPWDYLAQCGLTPWAYHLEQSFFRALDAICVATEFHASLLEKWDCPMRNVHVTGLPLYPDFVTSERLARKRQKQRLVVFPHRLAPEKQPGVFDALRLEYYARYGDDGTQWLRTKDIDGLTKDVYYDTLASARVAVSCARQETWGIAMIEAMHLGCFPVAPARLSYPETVGGQALLYNTGVDAVELIRWALETPIPYFEYNGARWEQAIHNVAQVMRKVGR